MATATPLHNKGTKPTTSQQDAFRAKCPNPNCCASIRFKTGVEEVECTSCGTTAARARYNRRASSTTTNTQPSKSIRNILIAFIAGITVTTLGAFFLLNNEAKEPTEAAQAADPGQPARVQNIEKLRGNNLDRLPAASPLIPIKLASNADNKEKEITREVSTEPVVYAITRDYLLPEGASPIAPPPDIDSLFEDNTKPIGGDENLTKAYNKKVSKKDQTLDTLDAFVKEQPIVTDLPRSEVEIEVAKKETPLEFQGYVHRIDDNAKHRFIGKLKISGMIFEVKTEGKLQKAGQMTYGLMKFKEEMSEEVVPPSALPLHRLLLGYAGLVENCVNVIRNYKEDPVKALVAMRQLELADAKYRHLIYTETERLKKLSAVMSADSGVGIRIDLIDGSHVISHVVQGGAADKDGRLQPGDIILAVGQGEHGPMEEVRRYSLDYLARVLKGQHGSVVRLKVLHKDPTATAFKYP